MFFFIYKNMNINTFFVLFIIYSKKKLFRSCARLSHERASEELFNWNLKTKIKAFKRRRDISKSIDCRCNYPQN